MQDRLFAVAFGISLGVHLLLLIGQVFSLDWLAASRNRAVLEVVYDAEAARQETRLLQEQLARARRDLAASAAPARLSEQARIRIPERPALAVERHLTDLTSSHVPVVDLTDLVDASRGDPVLLGYFSAIREQIQQAANRQSWLNEGGSAGGLVYVSFVLAPDGAIQGAAIEPNRSAPSEALREVALRIVTTAAPFPAFPPSMAEPSKTIVVPLEFLLGS